MKRTILALAVLMLAVPAFGRVDVYCTADSNVVTVRYNVVGEPNLVRAFGLDITTGDANIVSISDYDPNYWVYPGTIDIRDIDDDGEVEVNDVGTPIAIGGIGANSMTIEMGSLYGEGDDGNTPGTSGILMKFVIDDGAIIEIDENAARAGVVKEDVSSDANLPSDCYGCGMAVGRWVGGRYIDDPNYTRWLSLGKPECWCFDGHWLVDTDGDCDVDYYDALVFIDGWNVYATGVCADSDNDGDVDYYDALQFIDGWNNTEQLKDANHPAYPKEGNCTKIPGYGT
jgi:hypothetical protein